MAVVDTPGLATVGSNPTDSTLGLTLDVLLDNLRSSHNVGSILRSCDGAGIRHVRLCGITSTPAQRKVGKTALGAELVVPWSYHPNGIDVIQSYKERGYSIWSLENTRASRSVFSLNLVDLNELTVLVVGNEVAGVDPGILKLSDQIVSIPMSGRKSSLNAAVAFGIVAYWLQYGIR